MKDDPRHEQALTEQLLPSEDGGDGVAFGVDVLSPAFLAINQDEHESDFSAFFLNGLNGFEGGVASGDDIIDDDDGLIGGEIALDAATTTVAFGLFANGESLNDGGIRRQAGSHGSGEGEWVGPERETADGCGAGVALFDLSEQQLVEQATDQDGAPGIEGGDAAIDVEIARFAGCESKLAGFDGLGEQDLAEFRAVGFEGHGEDLG